ncbi:MAG: aminotransferase class IV [Luteolibacter sp.]
MAEDDGWMGDLQGRGPPSHLGAMQTLWCNGQWIDSAQAAVSWSDRGLLHGLGLFETLLAVDGQPMHVNRHLSRLSNGIQRLGWKMPRHDLLMAMCELLEQNQLQQGRARLRLGLTAGSGPIDDLTIGENACCWISAAALAPVAKSLKLGISPWRKNEHSALRGLKCASYCENLMALDWARTQGLHEVIFLNTEGYLCEAATANLFLVKNGTLFTPCLESGCLPGVTRELVLEIAGEIALEKPLCLDDLEAADECFLTSATRGVMPASAVGDREFEPGPLTAELTKKWEAHLKAAGGKF